MCTQRNSLSEIDDSFEHHKQLFKLTDKKIFPILFSKLFLNFKMPAIIGILTLISVINATSAEILKARNAFIFFSILIFMSSFTFMLSWVEQKISFYNLWDWCHFKINCHLYNGASTWYLSRDVRFPTMWYLRPAKPQISLRIRAVWSEPSLDAWMFYEC